MTFVSRLKQLDKDPESGPYYKTNNESGPGGPLNIDQARDWEISWNKGRAELLHRPVKTTLKKTVVPETTKDNTWHRGGVNTGTLPSNPNGPIDHIQYTNKDTKITEENVMSYVARIAQVLAKTLTFQETIQIIKKLFPDIKMRFPSPPTYVWNPPKEGADKKKEDENDGKGLLEQGSDAQLVPQAIKDQIKTKIPDIIWDTRMIDGIENAEMFFEDGSSALFEIGLNANHLTITYTAPPEDSEEEKAPKNVDNPAFTGI